MLLDGLLNVLAHFLRKRRFEDILELLRKEAAKIGRETSLRRGDNHDVVPAYVHNDPRDDDLEEEECTMSRFVELSLGWTRLTGFPMHIKMNNSACWNAVIPLKLIVVSPQTVIALTQLNSESVYDTLFFPLLA